MFVLREFEAPAIASASFRENESLCSMDGGANRNGQSHVVFVLFVTPCRMIRDAP